MSDCIHDRVYSSMVNIVTHSKAPWICRECGEQGVDGGVCNVIEYHELHDKFEKEYIQV